MVQAEHNPSQIVSLDTLLLAAYYKTHHLFQCFVPEIHTLEILLNYQAALLLHSNHNQMPFPLDTAVNAASQ